MHYTEIFKNLTQNIEKTITVHSQYMPHELTNAKRQELRKAAEDLKFIKALDHKLPESLEFCTLPSARVENATSQKLRKEFKDAAKQAYIANTASAPENRKALMDMNLTEQEIHELAASGLTRVVRRNGKQLDITVDHIHELTLGGENKFENFMLIPDFLNQIKCRLIHIQERLTPDCAARISIKPKKGAAIPFVETGFRPRASGRILCQQIDDFLGLEL